MQEMQDELAAAGLDIVFLAVNAVSGVNHQQNLIDKCSFPLFQDTEEQDVWGLHQGKKDDIYIYDATGLLRSFLPYAGAVQTNLSSEEGYNNLKTAILNAL